MEVVTCTKASICIMVEIAQRVISVESSDNTLENISPTVLPRFTVCSAFVLFTLNGILNIKSLSRKSMSFQLSVPLFVPKNVNIPCAPRNITRARCALLQIAAFLHLRGCCEMLMQFGFRPKLYYLCTSEEERAHRDGVFSSFFAKILTYKG